MKRTEDAWLLVVAMMPIVIVAMGALVVVPQFDQVFRSFGASLPLSTRVVLASFRWWNLLALAVVPFWFGWPNDRNRAVAVMGLGCGVAAVLFVFGLYACYAPIFGLAAEVGQ